MYTNSLIFISIILKHRKLLMFSCFDAEIFLDEILYSILFNDVILRIDFFSY